MAGHFDRGDVVIDTHEGPIIDPVWDLYEFTVKEMGRPVSTLIEWDTNVPPLKQVVDEALHAQRILDQLGNKSLRDLSGLPKITGTALLEELTAEPVRSKLAEHHEAVGAR
jgi:uncharacterized protein (UPF0276 family)